MNAAVSLDVEMRVLFTGLFTSYISAIYPAGLHNSDNCFQCTDEFWNELLRTSILQNPGMHKL